MKADNNKEQPIIYKFDGRNKLVVLVEKVIVILGTLLLWFYFIKHLYGILLTDGTKAKTISMVIFLFLIAVLEILVLGLWQGYNKMMFGKKDRRKGFPMLSDCEMAGMYGMQEEELAMIRGSKKISVVEIEEVLYWKIGNKFILLGAAAKIEIQKAAAKKYLN